MDVVRKDATITNTDDAFPGAFEVVLSTGSKDRDGEYVRPEEWKTPLPDHITFDIDHGRSVATTIGSGVPRIDATGKMIVSGTYSSLPRAQEARTLVNEGHIKTTSVVFLREKTMKSDGTMGVRRELLNGSFVSIPANPDAVVLSSKSFAEKAGARNSATDQTHLDEIARHAIALGANITTGGDTSSNEDVAAGKSLRLKDAGDDPAAQIAAIDAALDQATTLFQGVDLTTLPAEVQQAINLVTAAETVVDELMDVLGIPDPDDEDDSGVETASAAAAPTKGATATDTKSAPVEAESIDQQVMAARQRYYSTLSERN